MNNWLVVVIVAAVCIFSAFIILFQQAVVFGVWFEITDIHHETFSLAFLGLGLGVLLGASIVKSNGNN